MLKVRGAKLLYWTTHSKSKMRQYGLSPQRVRRVLHLPSRIERGIAPETVAYMQRAGNVKHQYELWVAVPFVKRSAPGMVANSVSSIVRVIVMPLTVAHSSSLRNALFRYHVRWNGGLFQYHVVLEETAH